MSLARFGVNRRADGLLDQIPPHLDAPRPAAPGRAIAQEALDTRRAINFADIPIAVGVVGDHMRPMELSSLTAAAADALSLGAALSRARAETAAWEAAAQEAVARADALADLLEDASKWSSGGSGVGVDGGGGSGVGASYTAAATGASSSPPPNNNNSLLAAERAARAAAEARVTALCVELGRARRSGDELAASVGPALAAVEAKLAAVRWPC